MPKPGIFSFLVICFCIYYYISESSHSLPQDKLIASGPVQTNILNGKPFKFNDYTLTPLADYFIEGRLLSKNSYYLFRDSSISPIDFFLGWQRMSEPSIYSKITLKHSRIYYYNWGPEGPPIPGDEIVRSQSNNHLIPANEEITSRLKTVSVGSIVQLKGKLVSLKAEDGYSWSSSMSREDTGNGNCELMYVENLKIIKSN